MQEKKVINNLQSKIFPLKDPDKISAPDPTSNQRYLIHLNQQKSKLRIFHLNFVKIF